jgi:formyl-CoA transferase
MVTGLYATIAIQAALSRRTLTGQGERVSLSMLSATLALLSPVVAAFKKSGEVPDRLSRTKRSQAFGLVAADNLPFVVHLSTPTKFWEALCAVIERKDLLSDARFARWELRVENYGALAAILREEARRRTRADWIAALREGDVPCAPAYRLDETFADVALSASEWLQCGWHPDKGEICGVLFPAEFDGSGRPPTLRPPVAGEDDPILMSSDPWATVRAMGEIG